MCVETAWLNLAVHVEKLQVGVSLGIDEGQKVRDKRILRGCE